MDIDIGPREDFEVLRRVGVPQQSDIDRRHVPDADPQEREVHVRG